MAMQIVVSLVVGVFIELMADIEMSLRYRSLSKITHEGWEETFGMVFGG